MSTSQLNYCKRCVNKKFGDEGLICGLTMAKPTFTGTCPDFEPDKKVVKREDTRNEWSKNNSSVQWAAGGVVAIFIVFRLIRLIMRMME